MTAINSNSQHFLSPCLTVVDTVLSALQVFSPFILTVSPWHQYCHKSHFSDETEAPAKSLALGHAAGGDPAGVPSQTIRPQSCPLTSTSSPSQDCGSQESLPPEGVSWGLSVSSHGCRQGSCRHSSDGCASGPFLGLVVGEKWTC